MIKALRSQDDGWHRRPPAGHGKIDRFGVKLIRNPLGLSERDLLVETCDTANRTLRCDVIARDAAPADLTFIETTWCWRLVEGETQPEVMQECSAGCVAVGESHDPRHRHAGTDNDDNPIYPGPFTNGCPADSTD